jgi:hypothetical protein
MHPPQGGKAGREREKEVPAVAREKKVAHVGGGQGEEGCARWRERSRGEGRGPPAADAGR